jgi:hypothetical protein
MHNESECFEITSSDGQRFQYNRIALNRRDRKLYKPSAYVELTFARQELKRPALTTTGNIYDTHALCLIEVCIRSAVKESQESYGLGSL